MDEKIIIYHTNDLHSHFEYWPRIEQEIKKQQIVHKKLKETMLLFDIGDHIDRFHPYTEALLGKGNIRLLNECGYDGITIGNNEGITLPHDDLDTLYDEAKFDCIVANIYHEDGTRPKWAKPYVIYETMNGTKIGVIGVTVNFTSFYKPLKWKVTDPFDELEYWIPIVNKQSDLLIVLSHLGLSEDERMAEQFSDIDIILGAHTHHVLPEGKLINNSLLCCTGKYGMNLGRVDIHFDTNCRKIELKRARLIPTSEMKAVPDERRFRRNLYNFGKQQLQTPVCYLPEKLETDWFAETRFNHLLSQALTEWCDADCSFINAGVLIDDLPQGTITEYDLHRICPHPINPVTVRLTGSQLKEVLVQTIDDKYTSLELKGFGFRGKIFGKIIYDRISIEGKGAAIHIKINGEELDVNREYTVATIDMFTFARFYPIITRAKKKFFLPEFLRDILKWKLSQLYPLS